MMNKVALVLLFAGCIVALAAADGSKSNGNLNPIFPPPPSPPNGFSGKDNYGKAGYLPTLDPNRQQFPIGGGPVDPSFGLMNIFGLIMPIVVLVGLGILLMPLIMGFFGGSGLGGGLGGFGGAHPLGPGYGVGGGGPFYKRRSEGGFSGLNLSKENIMDLITTVSEAIDKVEKTFAKKKN